MSNLQILIVCFGIQTVIKRIFDFGKSRKVSTNKKLPFFFPLSGTFEMSNFLQVLFLFVINSMELLGVSNAVTGAYL